jgi:hypothetical protein
METPQAVPQPQKQEDHPNLNKGNPGNSGGKMKHDPEIYADQLIQYFDTPPNKEVMVVTTGRNDYSKEEPKLFANPLPSLMKFAKSIGVETHSLERWATKRYKDKDPKIDPKLWGKLRFPKFATAYTRAKELQKFFIIENGLNGLYNPQFAIFVAKNITDMKDKTETDLTTNGKDLPIPLLGGSSVSKNHGSR